MKITDESKWQRIRFMPCHPLGEDGQMVTASREHIALSRQAACEGMVLLKNEQEILPFPKGTKLAVFGKAQVDYVKGGGGSGDVCTPYIRSLRDGLAQKEQGGKLSVFAPLTEFYAENVRQQYAQGVQPGLTVESALPEELIRNAREFADTALITICRFSGEGWDRSGEAFDGDFYLSREEDAMVRQVLAAFDKVVVVLNTGGMMDTAWFRQEPKIGGALLAWQGGMEGGLAMADILCGDICPSGRLTDTFATDFAAYPSSENFHESKMYVEYQEDIYVGYRYFETIPGAAEKVCYPFGYGLSYTTFAIADIVFGFEGDALTVSARITNTGKRAGKQVVQLYAEAPQGKLGKASRVLVDFGKTKELAPGEAEVLEFRVPLQRLASFDDTGKVAANAYVLEAGTYYLHLGTDVRSTVVAGEYTVTDDRVIEQLSAKCVPTGLTRRLRPDGTYEALDGVKTEPRPWVNPGNVPGDSGVSGQPAECPWGVTLDEHWRPLYPQLIEVHEGKKTLSELMDCMTDAQMVHLLCGQPNRGVANTFGFGNLPPFGIPNAMTADGPAGLRLWPEVCVKTTAFSCATLLACTWNTELVYRVGQAGGEEVRENGIGIWLAPAANIHRSPLCGRNFEYYSEDPLVSGKMAAAMVGGIQSRGVAATMKHFACNNKETNRMDSDSRLSQRALREIYLKAFEICVKEAEPWVIMSSYNLINGLHTSANRELLTDILRGEWGFDGAVTTDWYTHVCQYEEIAAGNDIKMGAGMPEHTLQMLQEGKLSREDVRASAERVLKLLLNLA